MTCRLSVTRDISWKIQVRLSTLPSTGFQHGGESFSQVNLIHPVSKSAPWWTETNLVIYYNFPLNIHYHHCSFQAPLCRTTWQNTSRWSTSWNRSCSVPTRSSRTDSLIQFRTDNIPIRRRGTSGSWRRGPLSFATSWKAACSVWTTMFSLRTCRYRQSDLVIFLPTSVLVERF